MVWITRSRFDWHIIQYIGPQNIAINMKKHILLSMVDNNLLRMIVNKE